MQSKSLLTQIGILILATSIAATAAMPLLGGPLAWSFLRAVIGFGYSGLFIATKSWVSVVGLRKRTGNPAIHRNRPPLLFPFR